MLILFSDNAWSTHGFADPLQLLHGPPWRGFAHKLEITDVRKKEVLAAALSH